MKNSIIRTTSASLRWTVTSIFVVAVLFNYLWERAQASFYVGKADSDIAWWLCLLASLGDGLRVLLTYAVGRVVLNRRNWFEQPGVRGYVFMLAAGLAISVSVEWATVYTLQWWAYTAQMPLVPVLGVGITPVLQMLVLPPLIFRVVAAWRGRASA